MGSGAATTVVKRPSVAVVGAGLAGIACALAAAQAGAAVHLFEERAAGEASAAHVDVVPNMLRDLVRLGVGDACVRSGFPYRRTSVIGQRGMPTFSLDAAHMAGARYPAALGITHAKLLEVLAEAAARAGVVVHAGARVLHVEPEAGHGVKLFVAGSEATRADLAVLACGAVSGLRERVFVAEALAPGEEWFYFLARRPLGLDEAVQSTTAAGDRAHVVPVGGATVGVRVASRRAPVAAEAKLWRSLLARFPGPIGALAMHLEEHTPVTRRAAGPGLLAQPHARAAVIAVGDCAHALPPHFGQSAAMAVEDAVVLGELLAAVSGMPTLAQQYAQRRLPRLQQVMAITSQAARWDARPDSDTDLLQLSRSLDRAVQQPA